MRKRSKSLPNSLCVRKSGGNHDNITHSTEMAASCINANLQILAAVLILPYHYFDSYFDRTKFTKYLWVPKLIPQIHIYSS